MYIHSACTKSIPNICHVIGVTVLSEISTLGEPEAGAAGEDCSRRFLPKAFMQMIIDVLRKWKQHEAAPFCFISCHV